MSLFRWIASSQIRLAIVALLGVGVCVLVSVPAADYIRYRATSPVSGLFINTGFAFVVLGTATLIAILIGDRVFPGRWRERVILGLRVEPVAPDDSLAALKGMKTYYLHFSILVGLLTMAGGIALHNTTGIFSGAEHDRTTLRGDAIEPKLATLAKLGGGVTEADVAKAVELIDTVWRDERQPEEVRLASLAALGKVVGYLAASVETWQHEGRLQSWQADRLVALRQTLAGELRAFHSKAPPALRAHVTYVLGALQDVRASDLLVAELSAHPDPSSEEYLAAVAAVGASRQAVLLPPIAAGLRADHGDRAYVGLAWSALELVRAFFRAWPNPEDARDVPAGLTDAVTRVATFFAGEVDSATPARRCIAAEVLRFTGHLDARDPLLKAFDAPETKDVYCGQAAVEVAAGVPGWIGAIDESLRARILQAIATISAGDVELKAWFKERLDRGGQDEDVTVLLQQLTR